MRDLIHKPAWEESDLGIPLPDHLHAVSVCLPTWDSIIGYEESKQEVTDKMQCGYPRFFKHPAVNRLFNAATRELCNSSESAIILPHLGAANRAKAFLESRQIRSCTIRPFQNFYAVIVEKSDIKIAMEFWRYTGEIISSRQALDCLENNYCSNEAPSNLLNTLSECFNCESAHLFIYENGMSAAFAAFRAATSHPQSTAKKTLQIEFPYVDVLKIQENFGYGVHYLNSSEGAEYDSTLAAITAGKYAAVFCEIPSNPLLRSVDIKAISAACKNSSTCLIVDDTICSHYNVDVSKYADLITTSLTKWISGKGDVMAGSVRIGHNSTLKNQLQTFLKNDNPEHSKLYCKDSDVLLNNTAGFLDRIKQANTNGSALADFLSTHPLVDTVWYPSLQTKSLYDSIKTENGGYGGLISIQLKKPEDSPAFFDALKLSKGPSLGTDFTLVCPYTLLAHYDELSWANACGVPSNLIRISVGTEPQDSLVSSFQHAFNTIS